MQSIKFFFSEILRANLGRKELKPPGALTLSGIHRSRRGCQRACPACRGVQVASAAAYRGRPLLSHSTAHTMYARVLARDISTALPNQ